MHKVSFIDHNIEVEADDGESIMEVAEANDIEIPSECGGNAVCGTCHVYVEKGFDTLDEVTVDEEELLEDHDNRTENSRLACQAHIYGPITVVIPESLL